MKKRFFRIPNLRTGIFLVGAALLVTACGSGRNYKLQNQFPESETIEYAQTELGRWLDSLRQIGPAATEASFEFRCDPSFEAAGKFAYACDEQGRVVFTASDPIGILHAIYTYFEDLGVVYDVTGATLPQSVAWDKLNGSSREVTPHVRWRGIRQHVNFPMDISSYPIDQASEYLQNLVRLRFNKLVVHSYPYQWYEDNVSSDTTTGWAGEFFYGNTHNFSRSPLLKEIATLNDSIFCIPAAEPVYADRPQRSRAAIEWMGQLLTEAKRLGLKVQFSFEPRQFTVDQTVRMAHKIVETYPQIDELEMITEETGGWGAGCTGDQVRQTLSQWFAPEVAADSLVNSCISEQQSDLEYLYRQIGTISQAIGQLEKDSAFIQQVDELKLGIYCSVGRFMGPAYRLARLAVPTHPITIMPSHGSKGTADAFPSVVRTAEDLDMTELYSWIEFDGLMYLQQNAIDGIGRLLCDMDTLAGFDQLNSVCFNHWRTAENRTTFRYASEATLAAAPQPDAFYASYATRLGVPDSEAYIRAMHLIDEADRYSTANLGNIGFCWVGAWRGGGSFLWMGPQQIDHADSLYLAAGQIVASLFDSSIQPAARKYLVLLGNRLSTTVQYLKAFRIATELRTIQKNEDGSVSPEEQKRAVDICDRALAGFEGYMTSYARQMPDRGSEGTVMSVWFSPMQGLRALRSSLGGVDADEPLHGDVPRDEPPLPIFYEEIK